MDITEAQNKEQGLLPFSFADINHLRALARFVENYMNHPMGETLKEGPIALTERQKFKLLAGLETNTSCKIFLWNEDFIPVALAVCFETFSTFMLKPVLNIHDFFVDHESRNLGIGSEFMEALSEEMTERGFGKITLEVRVDNDPAQGLYRKVGFNPTNPNMLLWEKRLFT